jgi:dihydroceramidase
MTGIGSYFYIVWALWLRYCLNEQQDEWALNWPSMLFSLPEVVLRNELPARSINGFSQKFVNGYRNGHAKSEDRKSV